MTTQFDRIWHGADVGKIRVAESGIAWRAESGTEQTAIPASEIKWAQWLRVARNFQLRIGLKDRRRKTFDGFTREDQDKVANLMKQHFAVILEVKEVSFKGWNWGVTDFQGQDLAFLVSNKTSFELPLDKVANSNIAGKTEVSLEFAIDMASKNFRGGMDELVEIRFHVPGTHSRVKGSDAGSAQSEDEEEEETSAAQAFHDTIKEKADIGQVAGDIILSFEEVLVLTPRGRYDVDMFPDFLRLRGKTYDYKIAYTSISRMFLLPKDDQQVLFILELSVPIRQGQTRYQFLVMQFSREEDTSAELNMTEEEVATYDRLKKRYDAPTFEVVSGVFRALSKKKIIGAGSFSGRTGHPGIKAHLKAVLGDLFLLEKYILFVSKQPTLIEIGDIHQVIFSRVGVGAAARTFDIKFVTRSGPEYMFTSVNKEELEGIEAFLADKKVKVKNEMVQDVDLLLASAGVDDEDDEMESVASSDNSAARPRLGVGDDEDSEADEDFKASDSDSGSPSESDSEGDAKTASDASGDREFTAQSKKKKKLKKVKEGKGKNKNGEESANTKSTKSPIDIADEAMDVDAEVPQARPKPKPKVKPADTAEEPAKKRIRVDD